MKITSVFLSESAYRIEQRSVEERGKFKFKIYGFVWLGIHLS